MKTFLKSYIALLIVAASSFASTATYTQSVSAVSSVTITGSTHGLGCVAFGVRVYDSKFIWIRRRSG